MMPVRKSGEFYNVSIKLADTGSRMYFKNLGIFRHRLGKQMPLMTR
jgi:hypothetical protein